MIVKTDWLGPSIGLDTDRHGPGTPCHSCTGFRSFLNSSCPIPPGRGTPEERAKALLDAYFERPAKDGGGLGGKLVRYVPWWLDQYRQAVQDMVTFDAAYRAECPAMRDAKDRPAYWEQWERKAAETIARAEARAAAEGIDLQAFFPKLRRQKSLL